MNEVEDFVQGGTALTSLFIALFFLRYWRQSRDTLFLSFSLAFAFFSASRILLTFTQHDETRMYIYLLRFAAFGIILWAIINKNRRTSSL